MIRTFSIVIGMIHAYCCALALSYVKPEFYWFLFLQIAMGVSLALANTFFGPKSK